MIDWLAGGRTRRREDGGRGEEEEKEEHEDEEGRVGRWSNQNENPNLVGGWEKAAMPGSLGLVQDRARPSVHVILAGVYTSSVGLPVQRESTSLAWVYTSSVGPQV